MIIGLISAAVDIQANPTSK